MQPSALIDTPYLPGLQKYNAPGHRLLSYLFCFVMLVAVFSPILESVIWAGFSSLDEGLAAFCVLALALDSVRSGRLEKSIALYSLFALYLLTTSLLFGANRNLPILILQLFLQSKYFIFLFFAARFLDQSIGLRFFKILMILSILGAIANILFPEQFVALGLWERIRTQFTSIVRVGGFQLGPNRLAHLFALLAFVTPQMLNMNKYHYRALLGIAAILLVFTGGRTGMALFALGLSINIFIASDKQSRLLLAFYLALPLLGFILYLGLQQLFFTNAENESVTGTMASFRIMLFAEGLKLAVSHFPFGSGLATYGTLFAYDVGIYETTAIASTFFYRLNTALYDNNLASIVGESGFIGLSITLFFVYYTLREFRNRLHFLQWAGILCFILSSALFESFFSNSICCGTLVLFLYSLRPYAPTTQLPPSITGSSR